MYSLVRLASHGLSLGWNGWKAVDLDASGTILAVGNDIAGTSGEVKVYQWSESGLLRIVYTLLSEFVIAYPGTKVIVTTCPDLSG